MKEVVLIGDDWKVSQGKKKRERNNDRERVKGGREWGRNKIINAI